MPTRTPATPLRAGSIILFLLPLVACQQDLTPVESFTSVISMDVKPIEAELDDGQSMRFEPVLLDQNGKPVKGVPSGMSLRWSVSDPVVASIDQAGTVTARRPGAVTVKAELVSTATGDAVPSGSMNPTGGNGNTNSSGKGKGLSGSASLDVKAVPKTMEYVSGDGQTAVTGSILPDSLAVRLLDRNGLPVPGADVAFTVTSGNGYVSPATSTTDTAGIAYAHWALGYALGDQTVEAAVNGVRGSPTVFHGTAVARLGRRAGGGVRRSAERHRQPEADGSAAGEGARPVRQSGGGRGGLLVRVGRLAESLDRKERRRRPRLDELDARLDRG